MKTTGRAPRAAFEIAGLGELPEVGAQKSAQLQYNPRADGGFSMIYKKAALIMAFDELNVAHIAGKLVDGGMLAKATVNTM